MQTILKAEKLTKTYKNQSYPSLNEVSFNVIQGEFIGIMGASGSGKTTLLNILSTIDTPTGCSITEVLKKYPKEMSGGQKQRVAAARAIVKNLLVVVHDN